jgi:hypothetical protein
MAEEDINTVDTIRDLKKREPFTPFKIVMSSGDGYLIDDPDALAIGTQQLFYYPREGIGIHLRANQIAAVEEFGEKQSA